MRFNFSTSVRRARGTALRAAPWPSKRWATKTAVERRFKPPAASMMLLVILLISIGVAGDFFAGAAAVDRRRPTALVLSGLPPAPPPGAPPAAARWCRYRFLVVDGGGAGDLAVRVEFLLGAGGGVPVDLGGNADDGLAGAEDLFEHAFGFLGEILLEVAAGGELVVGKAGRRNRCRRFGRGRCPCCPPRKRC